MTETVRTGNDRFVLLADLWDGYRLLEARHNSAEAFIRDKVADSMHKALREAMPNLTILSIENLLEKTQCAIREDEFVVTLDGGILFPFADFRVEITRAATSVRSSVEGNYMRVARGMAPQLSQQATTLSNAYKASLKNNLIVCDDGIGTGRTIKKIVLLLKQFDIRIARFITITNPNNLSEVDGIPITTIYPVTERFIWLNERDLYWGLPRSGLSVCRADQFVSVGGVPYTLSVEMVKKRIGLPEEFAPRFRQANLTLNKSFWRHLEELHGRTLTVKDCNRLHFFGDELKEPDLSIVALIEQTESGDILKRLDMQ